MTNLRHHHIPSTLFWSSIPEQSASSIYMKPIGDYNHNAFPPSFSSQHYAHECSIIRQDVEPSNIIIIASKPYLVDLGSATDFSDSSVCSNDIIRGTPNYLASQDRSGVPRGRKAGIFALGCVFAATLTASQGQKGGDYDAQRQNSQISDSPHAFRYNLETVKEWLYSFECPDENDIRVRDTLVTMPRLDANRRPWPKTLLRDFQQVNMVCKDCQT